MGFSHSRADIVCIGLVDAALYEQEKPDDDN
jgi:hypothetical protein